MGFYICLQTRTWRNRLLLFSSSLPLTTCSILVVLFPHVQEIIKKKSTISIFLQLAYLRRTNALELSCSTFVITNEGSFFHLQALCVDAYDEVDRRSANELWAKLLGTTEAPAGEHFSVPFLPTNPTFSATRNQGRQKLARLTAQEFATLLVDILMEARARLKELSPSMRRSLLLSGATEPAPEVGEEDPVYDQVPADESDFGSAADVRNAVSSIAKVTVNGGGITVTTTATAAATASTASTATPAVATVTTSTTTTTVTNSAATSQVRFELSGFEFFVIFMKIVFVS